MVEQSVKQPDTAGHKKAERVGFGFGSRALYLKRFLPYLFGALLRLS